jgi:hypothetical protein
VNSLGFKNLGKRFRRDLLDLLLEPPGADAGPGKLASVVLRNLDDVEHQIDATAAWKSKQQDVMF